MPISFKRLRTLAASSVAVLALAAPALAAPVGEHLLIQNAYAPGYCLDASLDRTEEGHEVYIYGCHGRYNQRWTLTDGADGSSALVAFDGKCLDIRGRRVRDDTPSQLWRCHYGANQQFSVTALGQIREVQSGKCLTIARKAGDRHPVFIDDCDGAPTQRWHITRR